MFSRTFDADQDLLYLNTYLPYDEALTLGAYRSPPLSNPSELPLVSLPFGRPSHTVETASHDRDPLLPGPKAVLCTQSEVVALSEVHAALVLVQERPCGVHNDR